MVSGLPDMGLHPFAQMTLLKKLKMNRKDAKNAKEIRLKIKNSSNCLRKS
jgi:hypothetical protein